MAFDRVKTACTSSKTTSEPQMAAGQQVKSTRASGPPTTAGQQQNIHEGLRASNDSRAAAKHPRGPPGLQRQRDNKSGR